MARYYQSPGNPAHGLVIIDEPRPGDVRAVSLFTSQRGLDLVHGVYVADCTAFGCRALGQTAEEAGDRLCELVASHVKDFGSDAEEILLSSGWTRLSEKAGQVLKASVRSAVEHYETESTLA